MCSYVFIDAGDIDGVSRTVLFEDALVSLWRLRELQSDERIFGHVAEFDSNFSLELYWSFHHAGQFSFSGSVQETNQSHV